MKEEEADSGEIHWGQTITHSYFPKENAQYFETDLNLVDWLMQYTKSDDLTYVRGFLGRMLFSGDEATKMTNVLSGGEKVRCMLARMMLSDANALIFDAAQADRKRPGADQLFVKEQLLHVDPHEVWMARPKITGRRARNDVRPQIHGLDSAQHRDVDCRKRTRVADRHAVARL